MSYTDNGDGTVTDNVTGLVWGQDQSDKAMSWDEAKRYCESLTLGGATGWRLPSLKELWSIRDFSIGWPYVNTEYFTFVGDGTEGNQQHTWSSNAYLVDTDEAIKNCVFATNDWTGHIKYFDGMRYVRPVRGDVYGTNDFVDNGDGTIIDNATGLMWTQNDSGQGLNWEDALAYAESYSYAGYDDWRLPNVKELQSIVDYTRSPSAGNAPNIGPAIDIGFFEITELPSGTTNYSTDYGYFWTSTSAYFGTNSPEYYYAWYVAFGTAVDSSGEDMHGAGAVRFDTKVEGGPLGEGGERYYNYVRLVRDAH